MKILIVDDVALLREDLREAVERITPGNEYSEAQNFDEAMRLIENNTFDIAFLDIQIPGKNGLAIAEVIKRKSPKTNVIMVTAYNQYALDALKLFVSGYILKPFSDEDIREALDNLRNPIAPKAKRQLEVRCFGYFEVFADGKPMQFKRKRSKELLGYLVCLKGATATRGQICADIFEEFPEAKAISHFKAAVFTLKKDLAKVGFEEVLIHNKDTYAVDTDLLRCDYYDYITGNGPENLTFTGEFMNQYSWGEQYIYSLENY